MPEEGGKMASLMACLSPREINIDVKRFTRRTWVHDLASQVHTGDIILFSSKHSASYITKFFTQSFTKSFTQSFTQSFTKSFTQSFTQ